MDVRAEHPTAHGVRAHQRRTENGLTRAIDLRRWRPQRRQPREPLRIGQRERVPWLAAARERAKAIDASVFPLGRVEAQHERRVLHAAPRDEERREIR
ncbi:hypothetical protein [Sandaracinus amylolyticus]|uniref:hypothetical protein n=1 Tax=Sandaracinus amylolyticus TaxID=927083 RepID=UPI001F275557|nr:hypothetical protein [Sandaracinus amylolyticus]